MVKPAHGTDKEIARQVIAALPPDASIEDIIYALYIRQKFARGEREIREGKGVPHAEAQKRLRKWAK